MKTQAAKRRIAIHEAGHAVIGRVLGIECGGATIEQDTDSAGHGITYDPHRIWYAWEQVGRYRDFSTVMRGRVMTFMAGREAEKECLGRAYGGDGDDRRQIAFMLDDLYRPEFAARWEKRLRRHRGAWYGVIATGSSRLQRFCLQTGRSPKISSTSRYATFLKPEG